MVATRTSVFIAAMLFATSTLAQSLPPEVQQGLASEFHFSAEDFSKLQSGQAIARLSPTGRPDDVLLAGAVLIKISSDAYMKAFRDVEHFRTSKEVIQTGKFSNPPVLADLAKFSFTDLKKSDILACHPGHCSYKMPAEEMTTLQTQIDWSAPDAMSKAEDLVRQRIIAYIDNYRAKGDPALAVYYDTETPYSVADGLHSLIGKETRIAQVVPDLMRYAETYPANRPANTDDFYYWQEAAFGLKHVLRTEHVIMQQLPIPGDHHYAIISKMLFATHYFRAAIEFQYVYPVRTPTGEPAMFLITAQRSYVDGMTGMRGAIVRKIAESRSPAGLVENLTLAKQFLERH